MPVFRDLTFISCNGKTAIHVRRCDPDGTPRGVVQLAHGIAEHIGRYDDFAAFLADNGFVVVGNDHLGHGKSINDKSELGYFADNGGWELAVGDMRKLYEMTREEFPTLPYFLFGHSMGSFLTRTYLIRYRSGLTDSILCGTGQQPSAMIRAGKLLAQREIRRNGPKSRSEKLNDMAFGGYNEAFAPTRTLSDWISRDEEQVDHYVEDPLCGYMPTASLFRDMLQGLSYIGRVPYMKRMKDNLPIFFISGAKDPVGEHGRGVVRVYLRFIEAGMTDVTLKLYHECRHEILNELNRKDVYRDILSWINVKMP